MVDAKSVAFL